MIKAFLFDNGGVMTTGGGGNEVVERLGAHLGVGSDTAYQLLMPEWDLYARGQIPETELWASIERRHGRPIRDDQRNIWNMWQDMRPLPEMVELVQWLKAKGYKVGLLSNVIPNTEHEIREHGGYDGFDFLVLSCEAGVLKPDPGIYTIAMRYLDGIRPEEAVFLDDQERFLEPAKSMGMTTVYVKGPAQAIADVKRLVTARR